jgi:hypothetical protein
MVIHDFCSLPPSVPSPRAFNSFRSLPPASFHRFSRRAKNVFERSQGAHRSGASKEQDGGLQLEVSTSSVESGERILVLSENGDDRGESHEASEKLSDVIQCDDSRFDCKSQELKLVPLSQQQLHEQLHQQLHHHHHHHHQQQQQQQQPIRNLAPQLESPRLKHQVSKPIIRSTVSGASRSATFSTAAAAVAEVTIPNSQVLLNTQTKSSLSNVQRIVHASAAPPANVLQDATSSPETSPRSRAAGPYLLNSKLPQPLAELCQQPIEKAASDSATFSKLVKLEQM